MANRKIQGQSVQILKERIKGKGKEMSLKCELCALLSHCTRRSCISRL